MKQNGMKALYAGCAAALGLGDLSNMKPGKARREVITACADGYIAATEEGDEAKRSAFISALMLLFWGEIGKMNDKSKEWQLRGFEYDDFCQLLYKCIEIACGYREWQSNPKYNAEQCIRQVIDSRGVKSLNEECNKDKRKLNNMVGSLDAPMTDSDGKDVALIDLVDAEEPDPIDEAAELIERFVKKGKVIEGVILDNIAYGDCHALLASDSSYVDEGTGEKVKAKKYSSEFKPAKLVKSILGLSDDYFEGFQRKYGATPVALEAAKERIRGFRGSDVKKCLCRTLASAKADLAKAM